MKFVILLSILIASAECLPLNEGKPSPPEIPLERFQNPEKSLVLPSLDDIKFTEAQMRSGLIGQTSKWRNGFFVQIDKRFSVTEKAIISNALYELNLRTCVNIMLWPSDAQPSGDYVFINRGDSDTGCWSYVGKIGGRQEINLQFNGCVDHGVVLHEAIHALGFFHEQSRPDRDQYVNIIWENIIPEYRFAFNKYGTDIVSTYNVPYDYRSIMHYNPIGFSLNGRHTIVAWNGAQVGALGVLTSHDLTKLRRMYNC